MQAGLKKRKLAFEETFALNEERAFKAAARANKAAGLWAAGLQGLSGPEAEQFALEVGSFGVSARTCDEMISKLHMALVGHDVARDEIRQKIAGFKDQASAQAVPLVIN